MAELETRRNDASVAAFLDGIADAGRRRDCKVIAKMIRAATGKTPRMWGTSIVGYDAYHYTYASGRTGTWPICGFSPRARNITLCIMSGFSGYATLLARLGKHSTGKSCLYLKRLADVDTTVLEQLIRDSVQAMRRKYPAGEA